MACEQFIKNRFNAASKKMIAEAVVILEEYHAKGFVMTLRQLHYQFVARNLFANTKKNYKKLTTAISNGRLAGLIDWNTMEDRLRTLDARSHWPDQQSIIDGAADSYKEDIWADQNVRPEVWIEKDALAGVIHRVCSELRLDFFACRGYVSQSAQYDTSKRFLNYRANGQTPIVLHFGDHDPSGLDMTRENRAKFELLTGERIEVRRLALNIDQIHEYKPPPNFAKIKDSRYGAYVQEFGEESWELDALDPSVIEKLIRDEVEPMINKKKWKTAMAREKANRDHIQNVARNWNSAVNFVESQL